jgi:hypothetical protein
MDGPDQLESRSSEHPYSADLIGPCASASLVNYAPPVLRYNGSTGYDDAFHTATVSCCLHFEFALVDRGSLEGPCRTSRE